MSTSESSAWAHEEFATLALGDRRRKRRWLQMASSAVTHPSGRITACFPAPASRQAAYKLLESGHPQPLALVSSAAQAALAELVGGLETRARGWRWPLSRS